MNRKILAAILLAALFSRLVYSQSRAPRLDALVISDMRTYHLLAVTLIEKGQFGVEAPWSYRPPLYPFSLAGVYTIAGVSWPAARLAQALLGTLSVWLLFLLARRLMGETAALLAALLAALGPSLIHLSGVFLSENLYIPWSLLLLLFLHRGFEGGLRSNFILAGVNGGLAALCRPAILPFLVLALLVPLAGLRAGNGSARPKISAGIGGWALMILTAALVISPWTIRNYRVHRRFVPISTNGGVMLWMGLHPGASGGYDFPRENNPLSGMRDEVERDRRGTRESLRFVRENPVEALVLAGKKFLLFWEFYPATVSGKIFVVYLVSGAAGLFLSLRQWRRWLTIYLYAASFVGVHLLAHSGYRYRYPLHPIIALWSALALSALAAADRRRLANFIRIRPPLLALYNTIKFFLLRYPKRDLANWGRTKLFFAVKPYTMLSYPRMSLLHDLARRLEETRLPGSIVECGSWNGGSAGLMAFPSRGRPERQVWLFDSWEGLPAPAHSDVHCSGRAGEKGEASGSEAAVLRLLFQRLKLEPARIHLVKGWFRETMPSRKALVGPIALLHLDCDWYESVKYCLEEWYDQVQESGFVVIDDYGEWQGCRRAVDEFFRGRGLAPDLVAVDFNGRYFQKRERPS
jgi:4-amino-4-deoxy-L-arabinose transferase-like glycosyltransferase